MVLFFPLSRTIAFIRNFNQSNLYICVVLNRIIGCGRANEGPSHGRCGWLVRFRCLAYYDGMYVLQ